MRRARQLARIVVRVRQIQNVSRLRELDRVQARRRVRRGDLVDRRARTSEHRAAVLVDAHVEIAKLEDVRLGGAKLEGDQARQVGAVLHLGHKAGATALACPALHQRIEVLHLGAAVGILRQVHATLERGAQFARVK